MMDFITNEWFLYVVGGFLGNGFITQAVALTPTKKDDKAVSLIGAILRTLTGTHGLVKKNSGE